MKPQTLLTEASDLTRWQRYKNTVFFWIDLTLVRLKIRQQSRTLRSDDFFGAWYAHQYADDRPIGMVYLGLMTKRQAVAEINQMPQSKITYIDDKAHFIFYR